ncbi:MAG: hypothetical protein AAB402_01585 [Patescibacteria group bacterium]
MILRRPTNKPSRPLLTRWRIWRPGVILVVLAAAAALGRSSLAEFEVPFIDTTNSLEQVEFRGVWAFNRGFKYLAEYNRYEAYAVGVDKSNTNSDTNGVFYFFDGARWSRVAAPFANSASVYSLNAVVGQENNGEGNPNPLWVVGSDSRIATIPTYYRTPGNINSPYPGQFQVSTITENNTNTNRDFYTIDAAQTYNGTVIAGGQAGLVAKTAGSANWEIITPAVIDGGVGHTGISGENVTAIRFTNYNTAYILTTIFSNDSDGLPMAPYYRDCTGSGRKTYLYKVSTSAINSWTQIASIDGKCGYGLAVGTRSTDPGTSGPLRNVLWIAASDGIYKYDEATGGSSTTLITGTSGKPYYAVTAIRDRGGTGTSLLSNGNFDNHTTSSTSSLPDGWLFYDAAPHYHKDGTGNCVSNSADYWMAEGQSEGLNTAVVIQPSPSYINDNTCNNANLDLYYTEGMTQRIDLSTIEGQKFRLTGWVKVEFPALPVWYPVPPAPQGGVAIGCAGAANNYIKYGQAGFVNCSLSNRKYITVDDGSHNGTNGWRAIDLTFSREDRIFSSIYASQGASLTPRRMVLEVRCEATYGAKVTCDDLKVEEISNPLIPARDTYTVIAAGKDIAANGIMVNTDALGGGAFTAESLPNKVRSDATSSIMNDVNAMTAVGLQHVFAVGQGTVVSTGDTTGVTLFGRTPSTLTGTIWAGATSPTGPAASSPIGNISVSCVSAETGTPTLCQRSPESYGISLERQPISSSNSTLIGSLTGRGWFGKPSGGGEDKETLDLGSCSNPPSTSALIDASTYPYDLTTGVCDTVARLCKLSGGGLTTRSCSYNSDCGVCDTTARRCISDRASGALTTRSCLNDFDCFGRCAKDEGFLCVRDDDCRLGAETESGTINYDGNTGKLKNPPGIQLTCSGASGNSPLACTPVGWLSFNANDFSNSTPPNSPTESFGVKYNTLNPGHNANYVGQNGQNKGAHELSGWGRFMTMANGADGGWVRLRGDDVASPTPAIIDGQPSLYGCRDCDGGGTNAKNCAFCQDASNRSCVPSDTAATAACYYVCKDDLTTHCATTANCTAAGKTGPCTAPGFCTGDQSLRCSDDATCSAGNKGTCAIGAVCSVSGATCAEYGVNLDTETGKFVGYAWSQDFGWLDFRSTSYGGSRLIQTKLGDIYATGEIGSASQACTGTPNATYLITSAASITGFCSSLGSSALQPGVSRIPLISAENTYQNILGRFDLKGIETETDAANHKNKYGSKIETLTSSGTNNSISTSWIAEMNHPSGLNGLGGKVYVVGDGTSNYTIDTSVAFSNTPNGATDLATYGSGAGILIVNGNLTINQPLSYVSASIGDLRKLASLTVVVKGNLTIANTVQEIVGAYYVTGKINTIDSASDNQYPLEVKGLMIAKEFVLKRQYAGTVENPLPSELIIFDGRLQSNPLPGMTDFANALPNSVASGP